MKTLDGDTASGRAVDHGTRAARAWRHRTVARLGRALSDPRDQPWLRSCWEMRSQHRYTPFGSRPFPFRFAVHAKSGRRTTRVATASITTAVTMLIPRDIESGTVARP